MALEEVDASAFEAPNEMWLRGRNRLRAARRAARVKVS